MLTVKRYTASWCQPCKQLAPTFDALQSEISGVSFQTIDVDADKDAAIQAGVTSVPTVVFEKDGIPVYRFSGVLPKSVIAGHIRKYL
jgi:thioredoxin-like negative regulator of GroEL